MADLQLRLYKEDFKFSAGHFLILSDSEAERLHGHNYRVRVDLDIDEKSAYLKANGFARNFAVFKKYIREFLNQWDERVLLPAQNPEMKFNRIDKHIEVDFRERRYRFPDDEVVLLPIINTSVEGLSRLIGDALWDEFENYGVTGLAVEVEETPGQSCAYYI